MHLVEDRGVKRTASALMLILVFLIASVAPLVATSSFFYRTYERMGRGMAYCVVQTGDGGYALVGFTQNEDYSVCWLVKTDPDGNMEWNKTYETGSANSIIQKSDGGYILVGSTSSFGAGGSDFWLVKTDSSGNTEWNKTYTLSHKGDWCNCMIQTKDGSYLLGGTKSYNFMSLLKTDSSGNMQWNQTYGYGATNSVIQTSDGGYALAGTNLYDFCLVKTDGVGIIPEFPSWIILPLFITVTLVVIIYKKRLG